MPHMKYQKGFAVCKEEFMVQFKPLLGIRLAQLVRACA